MTTITNKTKKTCLKTCGTCGAADVKIGRCGYCRDDCCELCARADGFDRRDICCYMCEKLVRIDDENKNCGCLICDKPRSAHPELMRDEELCEGCNETHEWSRRRDGYIPSCDIIPRNRRTTIPAVPTGRKFIITLKGGKIVKKTEI